MPINEKEDHHVRQTEAENPQESAPDLPDPYSDFELNGGKKMSVFRVEKTRNYTVMSNHHLQNNTLTLKAKGLLSVILSLPEDWDYTLKGLAIINREGIDAIREAIRELEHAGYVQRARARDEQGKLRGTEYVIYEYPQQRDEGRVRLSRESLCWMALRWECPCWKSLCRKILRWKNLHRKIQRN